MEVFEHLQVFPPKCLCLTSMQEAGENNDLVHFELC